MLDAIQVTRLLTARTKDGGSNAAAIKRLHKQLKTDLRRLRLLGSHVAKRQWLDWVSA
jgi:hypothetical protein